MNMYQNAKLTPAGREELVRRVFEDGLTMKVVGRPGLPGDSTG